MKSLFLLWVDEAGRGSWAGPVVAGACALRKGMNYPFSPLLNDSKKLSPTKREEIFKMIQDSMKKWLCFGGVGIISSEIIDHVGIREANRLAMQEALRQVLSQVGENFEFIKIDGRDNYRFDDINCKIVQFPEICKNDNIRMKSDAIAPPCGVNWNEPYDLYGEWETESLNTKIEVIPHFIEYIVRGDTFVPEIQAASILAKVNRDHLMIDLTKVYPDYGFERHKGYGTRLHEELLNIHRPSDIHRKSYAPIKKLILEEESILWNG